MNSPLTACALCTLLFYASPVVLAHTDDAPPEMVDGFSVERLHEGAIHDVQGKNVVVARVILQPGVTETEHTHPGVEILYILKGSGVLNLDRKQEIVVTRDEVFKVEKGQVKALSNTSDTEALEVLAFIVADADEPVASTITD